MNTQRLIVIVGTAHKVGSTWVFKLVQDLCNLQAAPLPREILLKKQLNPVDADLSEILPYLMKLDGRYILKSHSYPPMELPDDTRINSLKFLTVIRDPRDVLVSASFYLANLEQSKGGWGDQYRQQKAGGRIKELIQKGEFILSRLEKWYRAPYAFNIRYKDLWRAPGRELMNIAAHLGLTFDEETIERVVDRHSFQAITGRKPGDERENNFHRKGIVGDWKNHFDDDSIKAFKEEKDQRWNRLLVEMGYEQNMEW